MLRKLRRTFIAVNMAMTTIAVALGLMAICFLDYQQSVQNVYDQLEIEIDRLDTKDKATSSLGGDATDKPLDVEGDDAAGGSATGDDADASTDIAPPEIGGTEGGSEQIPVALYERTSEGELIALASNMSATLSADVLERACSYLDGVSDGSGSINELGLFYAIRTTADGTTIFAFADMGSASSWKQLAITLAVVGAGILLLFFVISVFLARWALRPVEAAWKQQQRFVADASHDLKTPLTVILANSAILLSHADHTVDQERSWIESTQHEAKGMQHLVQELLELARIDEGIPQQAATKLDFSRVVDGEVLQFESVAFERGITFDATLEPGLIVMADRDACTRLVRTLLDNACKYADASVPVAVRLERAGSTARLSVRNAGPVIPADELEHLFDRFYRTDRARSQSENAPRGYGLGLSIAQGIAQQLGGTLRATSTAEEGTTFTCTLPLA